MLQGHIRNHEIALFFKAYYKLGLSNLKIRGILEVMIKTGHVKNHRSICSEIKDFWHLRNPKDFKEIGGILSMSRTTSEHTGGMNY